MTPAHSPPMLARTALSWASFMWGAGARLHVHTPEVPKPMPPAQPPQVPPASPPETPTEPPPDIKEPDVPDEDTPPAGDPPRDPKPMVSRH